VSTSRLSVCQQNDTQRDTCHIANKPVTRLTTTDPTHEGSTAQPTAGRDVVQRAKNLLPPSEEEAIFFFSECVEHIL